jgi:hypothetical protein
LDKDFLEQNLEYVAHKLGFTLDELQQLFDSHKKTYRDCNNTCDLIDLGANLMRKLGLEKRYFR